MSDRSDVRSNLARRRGQSVGRAFLIFASLLDVLWAYPCAMWISTWGFLGLSGVPLNFAGALILILGAEEVTRYALGRPWRLAVSRLVTLLALALLLALVVRMELGGGLALWDATWWASAGHDLRKFTGAMAFGSFLLWRGIVTGRAVLTLDDLYQKFFIGLGALILVFVLWEMSDSGGFQRVLASAGFFVVVYFSMSLLGMAMVNLQSGQRGMLPHEVVSSLLNWNWLSLFLAVVLAIVSASVVVAIAFSVDLLGVFVRSVGTLVGWLFTAVLYVVVYPIALVASLGFYALRYLLSLVTSEEAPQVDIIDLQPLRDAATGEAPGIPEALLLGLKWGLAALVLALVVYILARALFSSAKTEQAEDEAEVLHESLWSWGVFKRDMAYFLASLFWRLRRRRRRPVAGVVPPAAVREDAEAQERMYTVQELYQGVLWEGRDAGVPRMHFETPYEYERHLVKNIETEAPDLDALTQAYVAHRYGGVVASQDELARLNRSWRQLRTAFQGRRESAPGA